VRSLTLQKFPYSETDWIVELFCEDNQVRKFFAHGARKSKRRFAHQFHAGGVYTIRWKKNFLESCDLIDFDESMSTDLEKWTRWLCILEWVRADDASSCQFTEILDLRSYFLNSPFYRTHFYDFLCHQIDRHGLLSELNRCRVCESDLNEELLIFSFQNGGVCHQRCSSGVPLDRNSFDFLNQWQMEGLKSGPLGNLAERNLDACLLPFLEFQLGKKLRSHHFLQKILNLKEKPQEKSWQNESSTMC
jgi:DNA repair protein RecO